MTSLGQKVILSKDWTGGRMSGRTTGLRELDNHSKLSRSKNFYFCASLVICNDSVEILFRMKWIILISIRLTKFL